MSKCEIRIEFDRTDRRFFGGESVSGRVHIRVNESVKSNGITLTHQWRTHGRGNVTSGPREKVELEAARSYSPGEEYQLPFSISSATHPLTYRGTLINLDHYVSVQMDVPWAFNPKAEEEYLLHPGEPPEGFAGSRDAPIKFTPPAPGSSLVLKVFLFVILGIILAVFAVFAMFLLPIILLVAAFVWFRRMAVASRLGDVQLSIPHIVVAPGELWTARVQFQPRKQFRINGIGLTLLGRELATSGSGTDSTTHTHKILEQKVTARANDMLTAGELVSEEFSFAFPTTDAYSLELSDNKIQWTAELRIHIPSFPDWSETHPLQVIPASFLKHVSQASPQTSSVDDSSSTLTSTPAVAAPVRMASVPSESDEASESASSEMSADLLQLVQVIADAPRHGNERADIVASTDGQIFDAVIVIDRVTSLMGADFVDPGYEYGKSVTGTIDGTDQAIQIVTPESQNNQIDDLRRGDVWQTQILLANWDSLYNRINARQWDENAG